MDTAQLTWPTERREMHSHHFDLTVWTISNSARTTS